jgi:hypothetical protein
MERLEVTAAEFASKYKSKREVYNFLTINCKAYLCSAENVTIYFLKDLVAGKKKCKSTALSNLTLKRCAL